MWTAEQLRAINEDGNLLLTVHRATASSRIELKANYVAPVIMMQFSAMIPSAPFCPLFCLKRRGKRLRPHFFGIEAVNLHDLHIFAVCHIAGLYHAAAV